MESHLASHSDSLISSLDFRAGSGASYVQQRTDATFAAESGNLFSSTGQSLLRFRLADSVSWLDPSSVRLKFDLNNSNASAALTPQSPCPMAFFSRMRIICGSTIEDTTELGRNCSLYENLAPAMKKKNLSLIHISEPTRPY